MIVICHVVADWAGSRGDYTVGALEKLHISFS